MNAIHAKLTIPALLLALLSPAVMAADAKHDDHGAAHAAPVQAAKPAAESKQADVAAAADEPAKPAPKKKRAKKAKKTEAHNAQPPATAEAHGTAPAADQHAPAHNDKAAASKEAPALVEPSKRLKLRKPMAGATAEPHAAQAANTHDTHGDQPVAPVADAPAASTQDAHAAPATQPAQSSAAAPVAAAHDEHAAHPPAVAQVDPHALVSPPAASGSKRVKLKKSLVAATAADTHASPASTAPTSHDTPPAPRAAPAAQAVAVSHDASHDTHAAPAAAAKAASGAAHADHADHAQPGHDAPATTGAASAAVPAKSVPAHSGHSAVTVAAPRAAEECDMPLKAEIAALFDRWNASLRTGDPRKVVANYAPNSILLPTVSNRARFTIAEKEDYFMHFLMKRPEGSIDDRLIEVDCNTATDAGLYTFRFADGTKVRARYSFSYKKTGNDWLITSHHSSAMPETVPTAHDAPVVPSAAAHTSPAAAAAAKTQAAQRDDNVPSTRGWVRFP